MIYKVYPKNSDNKDAIMTFNADNLERAIAFASEIKKLSIEEFSKLFRVVNVN